MVLKMIAPPMSSERMMLSITRVGAESGNDETGPPKCVCSMGAKTQCSTGEKQRERGERRDAPQPVPSLSSSKQSLLLLFCSRLSIEDATVMIVEKEHVEILFMGHKSYHFLKNCQSLWFLEVKRLSDFRLRLCLVLAYLPAEKFQKAKAGLILKLQQKQLHRRAN